MARKDKDQWEYGDFQTPLKLAESAVRALRRFKIKPKSVLEPTCGKGAFLLAAIKTYPEAMRFVGIDINKQYIYELQNQTHLSQRRDVIDLQCGDFFCFDWRALLDDMPQPILIVGNPPWVTSSELGLLASANIPKKSNFQERPLWCSRDWSG